MGRRCRQGRISGCGRTAIAAFSRCYRSRTSKQTWSSWQTLNIIDGQQRLTTLQYLLCALSMQLRKRGVVALLSHVQGCIWNSNPDTMEQPEIEIFEVWPTFRDRSAYQTAMRVENAANLIEAFPDSFTQSGTLKRKGFHHPSALAAIWFFLEAIEQWLGERRAENMVRCPISWSD